jgi:hypothetical protein
MFYNLIAKLSIALGHNQEQFKSLLQSKSKFIFHHYCNQSLNFDLIGKNYRIEISIRIISK